MTNPNKQKKVDQIRRGLEEDLHHPPVRFLGAFDSVPGDKWDKLKLVDCHAIQDFKLAKNVEHAVHILSVDDNRHPSFEPLLWEGKARNDQFLRQIWMPGVHADVGGCSNSVFIGNLAALTMIELLQEKCPELLFDNDYIDGLEKSTFDPNLILQITNERPDFWRRLLGRKLRSAKGGAEQAKHHLLSQLVGRPLNIRGKNRQYCAKHITSIVKTTHHTRYDMRIDDALEGYGPRQQCCEHC